MTVVISPEATDDLDAIWHWNARRYSVRHANGYLAFLRGKIDGLIVMHSRTPVLPGVPSRRYLLIRRKARGNGHVVVFKLVGATIDVLRVYHTAQDWRQA